MMMIGLTLLSTPAGAQVVVNNAALQQLAGIEPAPAPASVKPVAHRAPKMIMHRPLARASPRKMPVAVPVVAPVKPPSAAPAKPIIAAVKPALPARPLPTAPASLSLDFATGSADISPQQAVSLQKFATTLGSAQPHFEIDARAPAAAGDPSVARRLSLMRAMAVRDGLVKAGIPQGDILLRALGSEAGAPADSTMVIMSGNGTAK
ncbi:MAG TPA: OmpA family protein [Acetobacteraceae bacterium]|nr:OmpA family protein [Acetobacteraceae bacterium]